ncbi:MAG: prolipoprotein diacylglyceryl transferase [Oscillospiraceae bacterium]
MAPFFYVFGYPVSSYVCMGVLGFVVSLLLLFRRRARYDVAKNDLFYLILYGVIGALVGSKLLYLLSVLPAVLRNAEWLRRHPEGLLSFLQGGFVFYGGLLGGLFMVHRYCRRYHLSFRRVTDLIAPAFPLFHVFGRVGCFLAGCCWGVACPSLGVVFTRSVAAPNFVPLFPIQLVEAGGNFLIFLVLLWLSRRSPPQAPLLPVYLALYGLLRFFLEFWRGDSLRGFLFLSTSQWISLLLLFGLGVWFWRVFKKPGQIPGER